MNNLTHAERASLNIVFLRYPLEMGFDEITNLLSNTKFKDFDFEAFAFREHFELYQDNRKILIEVFRVQGIVIDALIAHAQDRQEVAMGIIRGATA
jgi:hypothetical protein